MSRFAHSTLLTATLALAVIAATAADAGWSLDTERSHLTFISIKAKDVGEVHSFREMTGTIDDSGQVEVSMMLDSVETLVPIRNERMRELLFQTTDYKEATLTAKIDPETILGMKSGDIASLTAEAVLSLHGATQPVTINLLAGKLADGTVMVAASQPLIIDAEKFGLSDGVEKLREIAGLESISHAVPVSFVMTFIADSEQGR